MKRLSLPTWLLLLTPGLLGVDLLQSRNRATETGNQRFTAGKPEEALAEYDRAAAKLPNDPGVQFNRGAALYALSRWDEAAEAFLRATEAKPADRKAAAFYNLGNAYYQAKKWKEATAAFKKALAYDPADMRAKWNLELALRKKTEDDKNNDKNEKNDKNDKDQKEDQKEDKKGDQQAKDDKKGGEDKGDKPQDNQKDQQAQDKPGQDQQQDQQKDPQQDQKKDPQSDKPQPDQQEQQAKQDQQKPPEPGQKPQPPPGQAKQGDKPKDEGPRPAQDGRELEAILDNLERSPKALEQELARMRASQRRAPAKDW
ncbi:MAG TPA: tetratricopeptide repeat protein [Polyangia bacterium]